MSPKPLDEKNSRVRVIISGKTEFRPFRQVCFHYPVRVNEIHLDLDTAFKFTDDGSYTHSAASPPQILQVSSSW